MTKNKYTFMADGRRVTVQSHDLQSAEMKARDVLNKRYEKAGLEPPVGWALCLKENAPKP